MIRLLMHTATSYRMTIGAIFSGLAALACYRIFEGVWILLIYYFDRRQRKRSIFSFCVCSFQFSLLSLSCRLTLENWLSRLVYWDRQGSSPIYAGLVEMSISNFINLVFPSTLPPPDPVEYCEHYNIEEIKRSAPWVPVVVVCLHTRVYILY